MGRYRGLRKVYIALAALWLASILLVVFHLTRSSTDSAATETSVMPLTLSFAGVEWKGQPVYRLDNLSKSELHYVVVYSWSNQMLPIIGLSGVRSKPLRLAPLDDPPYTLKAPASLWFAGPTGPPSTFTVSWQNNSHVQYETLYVSK